VAREGESTRELSSQDQPDWHLVSELLKANQYERLAECLYQAQTAFQDQADLFAAQVLALASRLCLACSQSQAEAEWHQQAHREATLREQHLRQQLYALLNLAGETDPTAAPETRTILPGLPSVESDSPDPGLPISTVRPGLWQRIRGALRHIAIWPPDIPEPLTEKVEQLVPPLPAAVDTAMGDAIAEPEQPDLPLPFSLPTPSVTPPRSTQSVVPSPALAPSLSLLVYSLGPFRVYQDDCPVTDWPSSKGKSIFKYLVIHRQRPVSKEVLMELFWPGSQPDAARNNLNVAIYGLRQALREGRPSFSHVLFEDDCYLLNPILEMWVDVEEFEKRCNSGRDLEQQGLVAKAMCEYRAAEALYQGEFLEEDRYEDWVVPLRHSLQTGFLGILDRLSRYDLDRKDYASCVAVCRKMLTVDACSEGAHRRLMRCYSRQGQPYLGLRQYHLCAEALKEELEVVPGPATTELYERIRQHEPI
jgi:DNA-binding SARP family transcriptional activator